MSTKEINDIVHSPKDRTQNREDCPIEPELMNTTNTSDGTLFDANSQGDNHMVSQRPQSNISTYTSSGLEVQDNSDQSLLNSTLSAPTSATTNKTMEPIPVKADDHPNTRSPNVETSSSVGDFLSSEQAANDEGIPPSHQGDLGCQDKTQIDRDQETEETSQIQFPNYMMYPSEYTEDIYLYRPGGHHPVHLGDILDGRFEVVHKLGFGGFSTVWLCLETRTHEWRAIKIIRADQSSEDVPELGIINNARGRGEFDRSIWEANHIYLPLEHFWIEGPNGNHLCEVLQVHGPSVGDGWAAGLSGYGLAKLNDMLFQVATSVKFLHDRGICHGDLTPRNILTRLKNISHFGKQEMIVLLGEPELEDVYAADKDPTPMAPRYKVVPMSTKALSRLCTIDELVITDFGESFRPSEEDVKWSGIPLQFAAPEAAFRCKPQLPSDIWSFACDMLLSATGIGLVDPVTNICNYVAFLEAALGVLPEPYRTEHIKQLKEGLEESGEDWKKYVGNGNKGNSQTYIPEDDVNFDQIVSKPSFYNAIKSNYDECATKYGYKDAIHILLARKGGSVQALPDVEIQLLGNLLSKMIRYDPKERLDIDGVLRHEWFTKDRASVDSRVTNSHANWVAANVDKTEPTSTACTDLAAAPLIHPLIPGLVLLLLFLT